MTSVFDEFRSIWERIKRLYVSSDVRCSPVRRALDECYVELHSLYARTEAGDDFDYVIEVLEADESSSVMFYLPAFLKIRKDFDFWLYCQKETYRAVKHGEDEAHKFLVRRIYRLEKGKALREAGIHGVNLHGLTWGRVNALIRRKVEGPSIKEAMGSNPFYPLLSYVQRLPSETSEGSDTPLLYNGDAHVKVRKNDVCVGQTFEALLESFLSVPFLGLKGAGKVISRCCSLLAHLRAKITDLVRARLGLCGKNLSTGGEKSPPMCAGTKVPHTNGAYNLAPSAAAGPLRDGYKDILHVRRNHRNGMATRVFLSESDEIGVKVITNDVDLQLGSSLYAHVAQGGTRNVERGKILETLVNVGEFFRCNGPESSDVKSRMNPISLVGTFKKCVGSMVAYMLNKKKQQDKPFTPQELWELDCSHNYAVACMEANERRQNAQMRLYKYTFKDGILDTDEDSGPCFFGKPSNYVHMEWSVDIVQDDYDEDYPCAPFERCIDTSRGFLLSGKPLIPCEILQSYSFYRSCGVMDFKEHCDSCMEWEAMCCYCYLAVGMPKYKRYPSPETCDRIAQEKKCDALARKNVCSNDIEIRCETNADGCQNDTLSTDRQQLSKTQRRKLRIREKRGLATAMASRPGRRVSETQTTHEPVVNPVGEAVRQRMEALRESRRRGGEAQRLEPAPLPPIGETYFVPFLSRVLNRNVGGTANWQMIELRRDEYTEIPYGEQIDFDINLLNYLARDSSYQSIAVHDIGLTFNSYVPPGSDIAIGIIVSNPHYNLREGFLGWIVGFLGNGWVDARLSPNFNVSTSNGADSLRISVITGGAGEGVSPGTIVARPFLSLNGQAYNGVNIRRPLRTAAANRVHAQRVSAEQLWSQNVITLAPTPRLATRVPRLELEHQSLGSTSFSIKNDDIIMNPSLPSRVSVSTDSDGRVNFSRMAAILRITKEDGEKRKRGSGSADNVSSDISASISVDNPEDSTSRLSNGDIPINISDNNVVNVPLSIKALRNKGLATGLVEFEQQGTVTIESKYVAGASQTKLVEDILLVSDKIEIPAISTFLQKIKTLRILSEATRAKGPFSSALRTVSMLKPVFRCVFSLTTPVLESVPLIVVWDDLGVLDTKESLLSAPFQVIDSDTERSTVMVIRPSGPTDIMVPSKLLWGVEGQLHVLSCGFPTTNLNTKLFLRYQFYLAKESEVGVGETNMTQGPSSLLNFSYMDVLDMGDVDLHMLIGTFKLTDKTPVDTEYYAAIYPGCGFTSKKGQVVECSLTSSLFCLYNLWRGSYTLRVEFLAKGMCSGALAIIVPPPGDSCTDLTRTRIDSLPRRECVYKYTGHTILEVENYSWVGWHSTKASRYVKFDDVTSTTAGLIFRVTQPPCATSGRDCVVRVIARIVKFKDLCLTEKSSLTDISAGLVDNTLENINNVLSDDLSEIDNPDSAPRVSTPSDEGVRTEDSYISRLNDSIGGLASGSALKYSSAGFLYAYLLCGKHDKESKNDHIFTLPFTMGNHINGNSTGLSGYLHKSLEPTVRVRYNIRNPYHLLCGACAYYKGAFKVTAVPDYSLTYQYGSFTLAHTLNPLEDYKSVYRTGTQSGADSSQNVAHSCGRDAISIFVEERVFRSRSRPTEAPIFVYFENLGTIHVRASPSAYLRGIRLYVQLMGQIHLDGYGQGFGISHGLSRERVMPTMRKLPDRDGRK